MPCEVGIGAVAKVLTADKLHVEVMSIPDAKNLEKTRLLVQDKSRIIMIGTYWQDIIADLSLELKESKFYIFCPKDLIEGVLTFSNVMQFSKEVNDGPCNWLINFLQGKGLFESTNLARSFLNSHKQAFKFIDDRYSGKNIPENQVFFTGIFNYGPVGIDAYEQFLCFFKGEVTLDEILQSGKNIVVAQARMAQQRVVTNSKKVKILVDERIVDVVFTEAPDLVNLTHTALHEEYPDTDVTLVTSMKYSRWGDEMAFSFRSMKKEVDVSILAKNMSGGGDASVAGGRVNFVIPFPEFWKVQQA